MTDIICDHILPTLLTAVAAWMTFNFVCICFLARQFERDMRREDEERET